MPSVAVVGRHRDGKDPQFLRDTCRRLFACASASKSQVRWDKSPRGVASEAIEHNFW
jgi:hypothetical protein